MFLTSVLSLDKKNKYNNIFNIFLNYYLFKALKNNYLQIKKYKKSNRVFSKRNASVVDLQRFR